MRYFIFFLSLITINLAAIAQPSETARKYLDEVFTLIKKNYYYADSMDMNSLKEKCYALINGAKSKEEVYPAIDSLLKNLFDPHQLFLKPNQIANITTYEPLVFPTAEILHDSVGYLQIPSFFGYYNSWQSWSDSIIQLYRKIQGPQIKGWIIDLRGNKGGDLPPMLTGIYPFLGEKIIFSLHDRNNNISTYKYASGYLRRISKGKKNALLHYKIGEANTTTLPVALLMDSKTASSAEMLAIAFKGRENTKFFGEKTAGLTCMTWSYYLSDKAFITFTKEIIVDNKGNYYHHAIIPDIELKQDKSNDRTKKMAVEWLLSK